MTSARGGAIHQVIVGAGAGDAITSMATTLRTALRERGPSDIFAHHIQPELAGDVLPLHQLPPARRGDTLIYHVSYGVPEITRALRQHQRIVIVYHNITPSHFFVDHQPQIASDLEWGRHELELLRPRTLLATAVSAFNAAELTSLGYPDVRVVPIGLEPSRLLTVMPNGGLALQLRQRFPHGYVVSVSQVLPHKRHEDLVAAMHLVRWVHESGLGLVVVGQERLHVFWLALHRYAAGLRLPDVWFAGPRPDSALATFFRCAVLFASVSAHEGLSLPPLEAMALGVPVLVRDAAALASTVGRGGVVLPAEAGPMLISEAIVELAGNDALRRRCQRNGFARVREVEAVDATGEFLELLDQVS